MDIDSLLVDRKVSVMSDYSTEYQEELKKRTNRSESMNVFDESSLGDLKSSKSMYPSFQFKRVARSGSMYVPPNISDQVLEKSEKFTHKTDSAIFLKDRGILRYMINCGEIEEARNFLENSQLYAPLYKLNTNVRAYLDALTFIQLVQENNLEEVSNFA